jgi:hypothetical protein
MAAMRIALAASMNARLAADASIWIDEKVVFRRNGHDGSFPRSRLKAQGNFDDNAESPPQKVRFLFSVPSVVCFQGAGLRLDLIFPIVSTWRRADFSFCNRVFRR